MKKTDERHNEAGQELLDPKPMQPPLGYKRAPSLAEQIRHQVMIAKLQALEELEETEDEADDFEVGDDWEPMSKHENDHVPSIKELRRRVDEINAEIRAQNLRRAKEEAEAALSRKGGRVPREPSPEPVEESED